MNHWKPALAGSVAAALLLGAAYATGSNNDVGDDAWYSADVAYVTEKGLVDEVSAGTFAPEENALREVIVEALWRSVDRPAAARSAGFSDVAPGSTHAAAVDWAYEVGVTNGDGEGRFLPDAQVTRQDFAVMLWRAVDRPAPEGDALGSFADWREISSYALDAALWANEKGIITGKPGSLFDPRGNITRAEVSAVLHRYLTMTETSAGKSLVIYFSAAGNTTAGVDAVTAATSTAYQGRDYGAAQLIARFIADHTGADLSPVMVRNVYPDSYNDMADVAKGEADNNELPELTSSIEDLEDYDTVFLVYPIWWYTMPRAIYTVLDRYDFSGKNLLIATTHAGSRLADSLRVIPDLEPGANVVTDAFTVSASAAASAKAEVETWLDRVAEYWK